MAPTVYVYALSTCPWCRRMKQFLTEHEVEFDSVDVDLLPQEECDAAADKAYELSGGRAFPVILIGEKVIVGYDPKRLAELLGVDGG